MVGLVGTFLGARGVANAMQNALNSAWEIPFARRPGFPWSWLRSLGLIIVIGLGLIGTTVLSGLAGGAGHKLSGFAATVAALVVSLVLNFGVFWLGVPARHRRGDPLAAAVARRGHLRASSGRYCRPSAATSCRISWPTPRRSYGTFAIVIGLIAWLYLQAELTLYAVEINVVRDLPAVAAQHRAAAVYRAGPPCVPAIRAGEKRGEAMDIVGGGRR